MFYRHPLQLVIARRRAVILVGLAFALLSIIVSLFFPLEYRADAQIFIISKLRYGADPYTVAKSAERIGENISQIITTNDFYQKVIAKDGYGYDKNQFTQLNDRDLRKKWGKAVQASVVYGTGVLNVSVFQVNSDEARQLAGAVIDTLVQKSSEYVGSDVEMKVVNQPIVTRFPVRPNLVVNALSGFFAGVLVMGVVIIKRG